MGMSGWSREKREKVREEKEIDRLYRELKQSEGYDDAPSKPSDARKPAGSDVKPDNHIYGSVCTRDTVHLN